MTNESPLRWLFASTIGVVAQRCFVWLWECVGREPSTIRRTSAREIGDVFRKSDSAVTKWLGELERAGLIDIERYDPNVIDDDLKARGDMRIWVYHPSPTERREKPQRPLVKRTHTKPGQTEFDFGSEIHCENGSENRVPNSPSISPELKRDAHNRNVLVLPPRQKPPQVPANTEHSDPETQATGHRLRQIQQLERERRGITNRDNRQFSVAECVPNPLPISPENSDQSAKKSDVLYISTDSIDNKYLNSIDSIEALLRKHQKLFHQVRRFAPTKGQTYLAYMVVLMVEFKILKPARFQEAIQFAREGINPVGCLQKNLEKAVGPQDMSRFRDLAKACYMKKSRRDYRQQLTGVK